MSERTIKFAPSVLGPVLQSASTELFPSLRRKEGAMATDDDTPDLARWAGGLPAFERLTDIFYRKVVLHPLLAPRFASMPRDHARHVAAFVHEVFSGAPSYSSAGGSHKHMIARHVGRQLSEPERRAWVDLLLTSADEAGLPSDPEFRASFVGYLEWGSRLALINSQGDEQPEEDAPMPRWGWTSPGGPYRRIAD
jgi:hemoglobin